MTTSRERYTTRQIGVEFLKHENNILRALNAIIKKSENKPQEAHSMIFKPGCQLKVLCFRARLLSGSNIRLDQDTGHRYVTINDQKFYFKDIKSVS